jgi:hypothetical protein
MCPACMTAAAAIAAGLTSTGGLAALAVVMRRPTSAHSDIQPQGDDHGTAENRDAR